MFPIPRCVLNYIDFDNATGQISNLDTTLAVIDYSRATRTTRLTLDKRE